MENEASTTVDQVRYEERGDVAIITLDREKKLNSITTTMLRRLIELFERVDQTDHIGAAVLIGKGRAFVAGADVKEYSESDLNGFSAYTSLSRKMCDGIESNRKPFVAAVNGLALGGGFELVLACDLVVASRGAEMGLPEIFLGLVPGWGGTQKLARLVGRNRAKEFLMTGRRMTAEEALQLGVVNKVSEPDAVLEEALDLASAVSTGKPPRAIQELKRLVNHGIESNIEVALSLEQNTLLGLYQTTDGKEGISAFMEKRKPVFRGE